ncbi:MAG: M16 family metallopeptidase [Prochloraceae cyanobacterium]
MTSTSIATKTPHTPKICQLPNGLTIIAEQMPVEAVNLNVWLNVGSALESDPINGMAHFLEHMVFKGTSRLKNGEFERLVEERGAVTNAATSQEYTHYYITTAPSDFAQLVPLQLDVILNPSIPDNAFERERMVVLEEIRRSQDNPRRRTFYRAMETCFEQLPYRRPVLGKTSVIEELEPQQMRDFHTQWYQPQGITAAVVGNLPVEELVEVVAQGYDKISTGKLTSSGQKLEPLQPEPSFTSIIRQEYTDHSLQQARLVMVWRVPGMNELSGTYVFDVLAAILGQGKMSRLFRDLREERQLVSQIGASNMTQGVQGAFYISAVLPPENIPEVEKAILEHIHKIRTELVDSSDLERIRVLVANRFIFGNERPSDRANLYGYYYSQLRDLQPALNYPAYIQALQPSDIQEAARRYISTQAYGIVVMQPA